VLPPTHLLVTGPSPREGREVLWWVYLSVCPLAYLKNHNMPIFTKFLCMLPAAVARSSSDKVAINRVLPVLWMTPCFHIKSSVGWLFVTAGSAPGLKLGNEYWRTFTFTFRVIKHPQQTPLISKKSEKDAKTNDILTLISNFSNHNGDLNHAFSLLFTPFMRPGDITLSHCVV